MTAGTCGTTSATPYNAPSPNIAGVCTRPPALEAAASRGRRSVTVTGLHQAPPRSAPGPSGSRPRRTARPRRHRPEAQHAGGLTSPTCTSAGVTAAPTPPACGGRSTPGATPAATPAYATKRGVASTSSQPVVAAAGGGPGGRAGGVTRRGVAEGRWAALVRCARRRRISAGVTGTRPYVLLGWWRR